MENEELHSILFPLIGTGTTRLEAEGITEKLIGTAILYFEENPDTRVQKVYFLDHHEGDLELCHHVLDNDSRVLRQPVKADQPKAKANTRVKKRSLKKAAHKKK